MNNWTDPFPPFPKINTSDLSKRKFDGVSEIDLAKIRAAFEKQLIRHQEKEQKKAEKAVKKAEAKANREAEKAKKEEERNRKEEDGI